MSDVSSPIQKITAVILTHDRKDDLKICLNSIAEQDFPFVETIVVDNNSKDGTSSMIREEFEWIKYIRLDENLGIEARNIGVEEATGDLIVSLDDDSKIPDSKTFNRITKLFRKNENLGIAAFRLIDEEGNEQNWFQWEYDGNLRSGYKSPTFVACGAAIRPAMFERIGGFWPPYFMYLEERDFALRTINSGSEVRYFPSISIIHRSKEARRKESQYIYYKTRNTFWFIWRNFPILLAIWKTLLALQGLAWMSIQKGGLGLYLQGLWDTRNEFAGVTETRKPIKRDKLYWIEGQFDSNHNGENKT